MGLKIEDKVDVEVVMINRLENEELLYQSVGK
jgi:hypothetical protein